MPSAADHKPWGRGRLAPQGPLLATAAIYFPISRHHVTIPAELPMLTAAAPYIVHQQAAVAECAAASLGPAGPADLSLKLAREHALTTKACTFPPPPSPAVPCHRLVHAAAMPPRPHSPQSPVVADSPPCAPPPASRQAARQALAPHLRRCSSRRLLNQAGARPLPDAQLPPSALSSRCKLQAALGPLRPVRRRWGPRPAGRLHFGCHWQPSLLGC